MATTRDNVSPSLILELLKRIAGIIKVPSALLLMLQAHVAWWCGGLSGTIGVLHCTLHAMQVQTQEQGKQGMHGFQLQFLVVSEV